ncbi:MAG: DUF5790 family protein [Halobacteriaceae archaeon]
MSQSSLDDEELFGEAAAEIRSDIENALENAESTLPNAEDIWNIDADNSLGMLNGMKAALDYEEAEAQLRDAKKWYMMGQRAGAFDNPDELKEQIDEFESIIQDMEAAEEHIQALTSLLPDLRNQLLEE